MKKSGIFVASFFGIILIYFIIQNVIPNQETNPSAMPNGDEQLEQPEPQDLEDDEEQSKPDDIEINPSPSENDIEDDEYEDLPSLSTLQLHSQYATLIRLKDGKIILDKNSNEKMFPASLTKMMTAIIAIENITDLEDLITLPSEIFQPLYDAEAAMAGFLPNENVPVLDLLYGTLLPSGAEAAVGLAYYVAGSEEAFVELMNIKAEELGMKNTHFTNVTGLHDANHYSTAEDMALLLTYALENEIFTDVFTSPSYSTQATNLHPSGITVYSTMFKKIENTSLENGKILGGKTGFTDEAGLCLASVAEVNGELFILVTAGASGNNRTEPFNIIDAFTVYNELVKY